MFRCILGERNSGKSIFIEKCVKKVDNKALYIATLPAWEIYKDIINRHQERRPVSWEYIELFKMSASEILSYPYCKFRNVILDNLTYYVLFQLCFQKDNFVREYDKRFFSLIDAVATDSSTVCYFIDTPIDKDMARDEEAEIIYRLFERILNQATVIERFHSEDLILKMTAEEGKNYLFHTEEAVCQKL